jgi:hypothetical protein
MQKENEDTDLDDSGGDEQADVAKDSKVAKTTPRVCLFCFLVGVAEEFLPTSFRVGCVSIVPGYVRQISVILP